MAIAAIVLHFMGSSSDLEVSLGELPEIVDCKLVPQGKIAVTLESPAENLTGLLKKIENFPGVYNLELVYANYEDDLDSAGFMNTPPERNRKQGKR